MSKYSVTINRFDGGLNTKVTSLQGDANESPDLQNVVFDYLGAVETRNGYRLLNSAQVGIGNTEPPFAVDLLHSYRSNTGSELLTARYSLFKGTDFDIVTESTGVFSAGIRVHAVNNLDYAFLSNGTAKYKYNGTDFTIWGVPNATTAAVSSIVSGNSTLAGVTGVTDYAYRFAYINSTNVESPASPVKTFTVSGTCSPVNLSFNSIATSAGVNYISIYRNDFLLNVVTASVGICSDTHQTLTVARDQAIIDSRPPNIDIFLYHDGYMFGAIANSTDLYYSGINNPESWDPEDYIRVGNDDGYTIRALAIYNNGLIIAKDDGYGNGNVYVLYMPDSNPENWSLELLDLSYGSISPKAICRFGTFLMMLNKNGIYDLSSVSMGIIDSAPISWKIEPDIKTFVATYLDKTVALTYKNKLWISVPYLSGSENNRVYQYDFVRGKDQTTAGAWSRFVGLSIKDMCIHQGALYSTDYDGYVYELDTGYNDNGVAIDSYYKTMHIYGIDKHKENMKVWRYIYVTVETSGAWYLDVSYLGDFASTYEGSSLVSLDGGGSSWGTAVWGISTWGSAKQQKVVKIPIHIVAKAIQLRFRTYGLNEHFKVYSVTLHYNLRGAR